MAGEPSIKYEVTQFGLGFNGPGQRWLERALRILRRKLRKIEGPYTIDDPEMPKDGQTKRNRKETISRVHYRMVHVKAGTKLIIRGKHYDQHAAAIRKVYVAAPNPLVIAARAYIGDRYVLGATPPPTSDCSGLTLKVTQEVYKITLPHMAYEQAQHPKMRIFHDAADLDPDDFIFYVYGRLGYTIDHVALNVGGGKEIGARPSTGGVHVTDIDWDNVVSYGRLQT